MSSTLEELAGPETCEESQDTESTPQAEAESPSAAPDSTPPKGTQRQNRKVASSKKKDCAKRQKTYLDPSLMLSPINQKGSTVCVGLVNLPLWQQFSSLGTEMLVNKRGRRMFPSIDITVTGLNPNVSYIMIMDVVAVSNWRYKYLEQEWVVSRPSTGAPFTDYYVHPKSPALGAYWMEQDISFGGMKLTNLEEKSEGMIRVHTMHCYQPRLHIVEGDNVNDIVNFEKTHFFLFPATYFFPVTSYMNEKVIDLKVKYNKYAKAFISTREAVTEGRRLRKESVSGCSSRSVDETASPCASHNMQEVQPRLPTLVPRGVSACQDPSDVQRYTPDALVMNRSGLQLIGAGQNCISVPNGSLFPLSPMQQPPLPGPSPLQEPLMHAYLPGQRQDTPPGCDTPTPSSGALYPPGNCNSWPPLGSTTLQPLRHHVNDYSEDVSPPIQPTDAVVDVPRLGEDIESTSSGMQSPGSKGSSGVSSMEGRGDSSTPLCLPTSQPMASSEPVVNSDTSVNAPRQQDSPHSDVLGNHPLAASTNMPTFSHMAPIPQFSMSSSAAGIHQNVNSSLHPVYFTNFQFVAGGGGDRIRGDSLLSVGHSLHPFASSDFHSLPNCNSLEHFPPVRGSLQSGLVSQSNNLGAMDMHPWSLASCKKRLLSPGIEDGSEMSDNPGSASATEPQEKQPRLSYQNSSVGVPNNGCLWTPLYVANYHSQLHHYNQHSSLPSQNSFSPMQHQPHSWPLTSTSDYCPQTEPSMQPPVMYNLHADKTASLDMQGADVEQCEPSASSSEEAGSHTSGSSQLSQWALHMTKGAETRSRLQVMPTFGLLPTYSGLGSVGTSARHC